jgi:type VI secretion system secreted protein VgrG
MMGLINLRQGPFVPDGGYGKEKREFGIFEQMERIRRGLPPTEPTGIREQMDRMRNGLPPEEPTGILAEIEREIAERSIERETRESLRELGIRERKKEWGAWVSGPLDPAVGYKEEFFDTWVRIVLQPAAGVPPATPAMVDMAKKKRWRIEGTMAVAEGGATLSGLAEAITGNPDHYKLFKRDPMKLRVGDKVDIMPLLIKAAEEPGKTTGVNKPTSMRVSAEGIEFMKSYEKVVLYPYDDADPKTVKTRLTRYQRGATIGYGHLIQEGPDWDRFNREITEEEANELLNEDSRRIGAQAGRLLKVPVSQNEFDALISLAFTIGTGPRGLAGSTVLEMINAGSTDSKGLESAWKAWNKSRGEFRQGLANRREDEWELYSQGDYLRNH